MEETKKRFKEQTVRAHLLHVFKRLWKIRWKWREVTKFFMIVKR